MSAANWMDLFSPKATASQNELSLVEDCIDEITEDMLLELSDEDELEITAGMDDPEPTSSEEEAWPRDFEEHLETLRRRNAGRLSQRRLKVAAAIAKATADLEFWRPMLELGQRGEFTGHCDDLKKCLALLEANPPEDDEPQVLQRWGRLRHELLTSLPSWSVDPAKRRTRVLQSATRRVSGPRVTVTVIQGG